MNYWSYILLLSIKVSVSYQCKHWNNCLQRIKFISLNRIGCKAFENQKTFFGYFLPVFSNRNSTHFSYHTRTRTIELYYWFTFRNGVFFAVQWDYLSLRSVSNLSRLTWVYTIILNSSPKFQEYICKLITVQLRNIILLNGFL